MLYEEVIEARVCFRAAAWGSLRTCLLRRLDAVAAGLLGVVEGVVGAGDHVVAGLRVAELRDAGREREGEDAPLVAEEARGEGEADLVGERARPLQPRLGR